MKRKCINCGRIYDESELKRPHLNCLFCGDRTEPTKVESKPKKEKIDMDLNHDGKIDEKDASIAGKVLSETRKRKSKSKKKK